MRLDVYTNAYLANRSPGSFLREREVCMPKKKYEVTMPFRMTKEQKEKLGRKAAQCRLSESEVLRRWIDGWEPMDYESFQMLRELLFEIHKIGVNINQIAKNNNSGLYFVADKLLLFEKLKELDGWKREIETVLEGRKKEDGSYEAHAYEGGEAENR